jgi:hypothetical protein
MNFEEKFRSYRDSELLNIIECPDDYQKPALEAARKILHERNLTDDEFKVAKEELNARRQIEDQKKQKQKAFDDKIQSIKNSVLDNINPIPAQPRAPERIIRGVSIVFGLLFILQLIKEFDMLRFMFTSSNAEWGIEMFLYFLPLIVVPIAAILFARKNKVGWILIAIYSIYSVVSAIGLFMMALKMQEIRGTVFDKLFPLPSPPVYFSAFVFFVAVVLVVCRLHIREIFQVDKKFMFATLGIAFVGSIILNFQLLTFNLTH